jgi:hypothetical protein
VFWQGFAQAPLEQMLVQHSALAVQEAPAGRQGGPAS